MLIQMTVDQTSWNRNFSQISWLVKC